MPVLTTRVTRVVDLPVQAVWDALVDHEGMSSWAPGLRVTLDREGAPGRNGVGALRRIAARGPAPAIREEITTYEAPRRLGYRALSGVPFRGYSGEVVLSELTGRTEVRWSLAIRPRSGAERFPLAAANHGLMLLFLRSLRRG